MDPRTSGRFRLVIRQERRDATIYALVVARDDGARLGDGACRSLLFDSVQPTLIIVSHGMAAWVVAPP
jgi:hypothetical protein